jgi:hydrogenase maturation protease
MQTLVLGIGNTLLSDEGAGVHAVHYLQTNHSDIQNTRFVDGGTLSFTLAAEIEQADNLIVIDATQLHASPGSIETFIDDEMDRFLNHGKRKSVHEVGLMDLIHISRLTGQFPTRRALIGIQPQSLDWGEHPSSEVKSAIPLACRQTLELIEAWQA